MYFSFSSGELPSEKRLAANRSGYVLPYGEESLSRRYDDLQIASDILTIMVIIIGKMFGQKSLFCKNNAVMDDNAVE